MYYLIHLDLSLKKYALDMETIPAPLPSPKLLGYHSLGWTTITPNLVKHNFCHVH